MKDKKVLIAVLGVLALILVVFGVTSLNKKPEEKPETKPVYEVPSEVKAESKVEETQAEEIKITESEAYTAINDFLKLSSRVSKNPARALTHELGLSDDNFDESKVIGIIDGNEAGGQLIYSGIKYRKFQDKMLEYVSQKYLNENYNGIFGEDSEGYLYVNDYNRSGITYDLKKFTLISVEDGVYTYEIEGEYQTAEDKMPFTATAKLVMGEVDMYVIDEIEFTYNNK